MPNFYKQDFNSNNPPKSYADVVNADRDPLDMSDEKEELEYHQAMMEEDSTTLWVTFELTAINHFLIYLFMFF